MRWTAAALSAVLALAILVIVLLTQGAGPGATPPAITVVLPASARANAVIPSVGRPERRIRAYGERAPASAQAAIAAATAGTRAAPADPNALPAVVPLAPNADARLNGVSVWVPYWSAPSSIDAAIANAGVVRVAHPFTDEITDTGTIVDQSGGAAASMTARLAHAGLSVIPTVTETAGMRTFARILTHPAREARLLAALVAIAEAPGVSGIDLDFENLAYGHGNAADAGLVARRYPVLVGRLCATLHRVGRSCEVTVIAKNDAGHLADDGLDTGVYDYARLGAEADRVQVMAYDLHVPSGAAGPIAAWPWVQSVIAYATTQVPAAKLVLGIPAYGYDWASSGPAGTLTAPGAEALARSVGAAVQWDSADAEPTFSYTVSHRHTTTRRRTVVRHHRRVTVTTTITHVHRVVHTVWFDDATADYDRAVLAADDHLGGVALWAAGDEDPSTWTMLRRLARN